MTTETQFEPFQVDEETFKAIITYLGELPAKYANPLISKLSDMAKAKAEQQTTND